MPYPTVSPDFMAKYDHATPSGFANDACKLNRLANIGIDCRRTPGEPIELDLLTDRTYTFLCETSDDDWLISGGDTTKLKRPDTAHAEIWRFGPNKEEDGGIPFETVDAIMRNIAFAPMRLKPLRVNFTATSELELLCAYDPPSVVGQLFGILSDVLACPCGDYGNPFHITLTRGVKFRSDALKGEYFDKMKNIVTDWNEQYLEGIMFHYSPTLEDGVRADLDQLRAMRASSRGTKGDAQTELAAKG
jgi:hypothetical protein